MPHPSQPKNRTLDAVATPAALIVGAALLFAGLGSDGLWEPWEMDRAQVSRDLEGPSQVLVGLSVHDEPSVRASVEEAGRVSETVLRFSPAPARKPRTHALATKSVRGALDAARTHVAAALILDLALVPQGDSVDYSRAWKHLDEALRHLRIGRVIALVTAPDGDVAAVRSGLRAAQVRAGAQAAVDPFELRLSAWPDEADDATLGGDTDGLPARLHVLMATDTQGLASVLTAARDDSKSVARFKDRGVTLTLPPLKYRLSAMITSTLGSTEFTVRLAGALLAFLALLAVVLTLGSRFGSGVAFVSGLVLATTPLFFLHGRSTVGEPGSMLALTLVALGLLESNWARSPRRVWGFLLSGLVVGFLAKGLSMLLALFVLVAGVSLIAGERRWVDWAPALVFGAALAITATWVLTSPAESFAGQFRFTQRLFSAGPTVYDRNFDWAIKRLGFGVLPWSPFLVLAMAEQVRRVARDADRTALIIVLWFTVPTVMALGMLKDFNIALWWGAPAGAVAITSWLRELWRRGQPSRFEGFLLVVMAFILLRELGKSPAPLVDVLAFDPPMADKAGQRFPEGVKLASWIRLATLGLIGMVFVHQARLVEVAGRVVAFFARPRPYTFALAVALILLPITWLVRVGNKLTSAMGHVDFKALDPEQRTFPLRFVFRSGDPVMVLALSAVALVVAVLLWRLLRLKWRSWPVDEPERVAPYSPTLFARLAAGGAVALGILMMFSVSCPSGYWSETLLHPAMLAVTLGCAATVWMSRRLGGSSRDSALYGVAWLALWLGTRLSRDAELVNWATLLCTACIVIGLSGLVVPRLFGSVSGWARLGSWIVFGALLAVFAPLVDRWGTLEQFLYPDGGPSTLVYLWTRSRLTWGLIGLMLALVLNRRITRSDDRDTLSAITRLFEDRRLAVVASLLAGVVFSVGLLVSFQPAIAFHVSQKHIMDTYRSSEGLSLGVLGPRIFRHGTFAVTGRANTNFYTAGIPAVRDRTSALKALLSTHDTALSVERPDGAATVMVPGWSGENDQDKDGRRDHTVSRGSATKVLAGQLEDGAATWAVDEHSGKVLVDSRGKTWDIDSNTETQLKLSGSGIPAFSLGRAERNLYAIDSKDSANHGATGASEDRTYMLLPAESFSDINYAYRKISGGEHIPVVDGRSARVLLAASRLEGEEVQQNRFALHTTTKEAFDALEDPQVHRAWVNFEDTIQVLGYRIEEEVVGRGKKIRLRFYLQALKDIRKSYKMFLHIDQSGNRIHGDHWPLNLKQGEAGKNCVGCFKSDHWLKGDVVMDVFETEVPAATPSGVHEIWLGFFTPGSDKRLKAKDWDRTVVRHDGHNRVRLGELQVR